MEPVLIIGILAVGIGFVLVRAREMGKRLAADWLAAAEACGLANVVATVGLGGPRLEGHRGGLGIVLRGHTPRKGQYGARVVISGLPPQIELRAHLVQGTFMRRIVGEQDIVIGDEAFDAAIVVFGDPLRAQAVLDAETRRRARAFLVPRADGSAHEDASLVDGMLSAHSLDEPAETRAARITTLLADMLALAEGLTTPTPREERLAENARADPLATVRLRNLTVLLRDRTDHPATQVAVHAALSDADEEVRLTAALVCGAQGHDTLRSIARGPNSSDAGAARAIGALGDALAGADAERILATAVSGGREQTIVASLQALARHGATHIASIAALLDAADPSRASAAAWALGLTGSERAVPALVKALAHGDEDVRTAAAAALGSVGGSAEDVVALRQAEETFSGDRAFRRAAREAIASVQSRLTGAEHGQLALTQPAGELSLAATDATGQVSPSPKSGEE